MAKKTMGGFDVLVDLTSKFVEAQKGAWDHTAWLNFLSDVQKKGLELSDDMTDNLGLVLESMKKFYSASADIKGIETAMADISNSAIDYFKKTKGAWSQSEWETYLNNVQKKGIELTDETRSYLGEVFESLKGFYTVLSPAEKETKTKKEPKKEAKEATAKK
jgi:hypothetical protein